MPNPVSFGASMVQQQNAELEVKPKSTGKKKSKKPTVTKSNEYNMNSIKKKKSSLGLASFNSTMRPTTANKSPLNG